MSCGKIMVRFLRERACLSAAELHGLCCEVSVTKTPLSAPHVMHWV